MGKLQDTLCELLDSHGRVTDRVVRVPKLADLKISKWNSEADNIYRKLGGLLETFPLNLRKWDIEFNGQAIELDEQLHFNRYRYYTLDSVAYNSLNAFPKVRYQEYCTVYENECFKAGKYGGKWSNPSCDKQYGLASLPGDLREPGPSRWKQRAYYDFIKDLSPLIIGIQVIRMSIWDCLDEDGVSRRVIDALNAPSSKTAKAILCLINSRLQM